jgi:hypothetical protein
VKMRKAMWVTHLVNGFIPDGWVEGLEH